MLQEKSVYTVQSVVKAFELLDILTTFPNSASLQILAASIELTSNKTYRLLSTLCENGLVEQEKPSGNYRVGINSYGVGS